MRIVMVSKIGCIRVQKTALPLIRNGHEVHLLARAVPSFAEEYKTFSFAWDIGQFIEAIALYEPMVDIWHVHNEPSYFVQLIKEYSRKPVVLDVHDSHIARVSADEWESGMDDGKHYLRITTDERNNFQLADALVFVSETVRDMVCREYRLTQPNVVVPCAVPYRLYRYKTKDWWGGLVCEGMMETRAKIERKPEMYGYAYTNYEDLAKECMRLGIDFHIYSNNTEDEFIDTYKDLCIYHSPEPYLDLLESLSQHDWGLVGNLKSYRALESVLPNKLFDYIAAGVPPVCMHAGESASLVLKHGIGIEVRSLEELASRWGEHRECRRRLLSMRWQLAMESWIPGLENLYRELL